MGSRGTDGPTASSLYEEVKSASADLFLSASRRVIGFFITDRRLLSVPKQNNALGREN